MQLTFFAGGHLANPSASEGCEEVSMTREAASCLPSLQSQGVTDRKSSSGKMLSVSCHLTEDGILEPSSGGWRNAGMGSPTEFLTLNFSEAPSNGAVSSLLDVLETPTPPQKYYLSRKALLGVLRRNERRSCRFVLPQEARVLSMTEKRMLLMGMEYDT
jgi:hypothetical protein